MITPDMVLRLTDFETKLPELSGEDRCYVLGHMVALETSGISSDASREKAILERLIQQFGWRLAYCRYVEGKVNARQRPVTFDEWVKRQQE